MRSGRNVVALLERLFIGAAIINQNQELVARNRIFEDPGPRIWPLAHQQVRVYAVTRNAVAKDQGRG